MIQISGNEKENISIVYKLGTIIYEEQIYSHIYLLIPNMTKSMLN